MTVTERIDIALNWLDFPPPNRPAIVNLYFEGVDTAGHNFGVLDYEMVGKEMKLIDDGIKYLMDELDKRVNLFDAQMIIVSDHGMANVSKENAVFLDSITVNLSSCLEYFELAGPIAGFYPINDSCHNTIRNALLSLNHINIYENSSIPQKYHFSQNFRIPPILVETTIGWYTTDTNSNLFYTGHHGWDNDLEEMQAIFIAYGSSFNISNPIEEIPNIEIYNLICNLLSIEERASNNGTEYLKSILKKNNFE